MRCRAAFPRTDIRCAQPISGASVCPHAWHAAVERRCALIGCGASEGAQAELQHETVVDAQAAAIGVISNIISGQDEAVINEADAHLGLADLAGEPVPR